MRYLLTLLLCALLLGGCESAPIPATESTPALSGLYVPDSAIERKTDGRVTAFPLPMADVYGIRMQGEDILVFSGVTQTTLTRLRGKELQTVKQVTFPGYLPLEDVSVSPDTIVCYDRDTRFLVVLDTALEEVCRYVLPDTAKGRPFLSKDREKLYYCTDSAVMVWELRKERHRTLKIMNYPGQELLGLYRNDSVLHCRVPDGSREVNLFLSVQAGQLLHRQEGNILLTEEDGFYFAEIPTGLYHTFVYGTEAEVPFVLTPEDYPFRGTFLPQSRGAVTLSEDADGVLLTYYDLNSGHRQGTLSLPQAPDAITGGAKSAPWLLVFDPEFGCPTLYRWDCTPAPQDNTVYTSRHASPFSSDFNGLEECRTLAEQIGKQYGIRVLIGKDAAAVEPWDYDLEPEYSVPVLRKELQALDRRLAQYPQKVLADTLSPFSSLNLCLVRQLKGRTQSGSLETAIGIQFQEGSDAYLVLAVGPFSEHGLYHEFFHLMDTFILKHSTAFDHWERLNPDGFTYDGSYTANALRDSEEYLHREDRAFVDTYSMSFPKEDRARILEYAMLPGKEDLFQSPIMQSKLNVLCQGIREAYQLTDSKAPLLWEQYRVPPVGGTAASE